MRALISLAGTHPLQWRDVALGDLGPSDVRVRVAAAGVNPVDWKMRDGDLLGVLQKLIGPRGPLVPGIDFAGEVEAVGAQVRDLAVGDRVVGGTNFSRGQRGSYASHVQVRADQLAKVPAGVDLAQAACLPVAGGTAAIALFEVGKLRERASKKVLILGASGGVGHIAVQLAKAAGATVYGVCSARNAKLVEELGATAVDYTHDGWQARIAAAGPWDVIVDGVGTASYPAKQCLGWLASDGVHVMVVPKGGDFWRVLAPGRSHTVLTQATTARLQPLVAALADGSLKVVIAERVPLGEADRAHELSRSGKVVGKVVLVA